MSLTPKINSYSRHGDALTSLLNLISSAPEGYNLNFPKGRVTNASFKSICPEIGHIGEASFTLGKKFHYETVLVGPFCYKDPARGRCGRGGGPDPGIGFVQRFTQECLNHDVCCDTSGKPPPVCGMECAATFDAAEDGFFDAPDCGTTAGNWTDDSGFTYVFTGGDSRGDPEAFTGTVNFNNRCDVAWNVTGTRTGRNISFTETNPSGEDLCVGIYNFTGAYNNCNTANGTWTGSIPSGNYSGTWNWKRTNTVTQTDLLSRAKAGPWPANK
ncbi:MAG: hypothetical protein ACREC0_07250 [Methylocella sp.]